MVTFTESAMLEHIVGVVLEADASDASYRRAIQATGAVDVIDFMMIDMSDMKSVEWTVTTGTTGNKTTTTMKLNMVQQRKLIDETKHGTTAQTYGVARLG